MLRERVRTQETATTQASRKEIATEKPVQEKLLLERPARVNEKGSRVRKNGRGVRKKRREVKKNGWGLEKKDWGVKKARF